MIGHARLAHNAALRTNVVCTRMRALYNWRGRAQELAMLALWFMAAVIAAKVRGEPRAVISAPKGWHLLPQCERSPLPRAHYTFYRMAVSDFPSSSASVPVMTPEVGVVHECPPGLGGGGVWAPFHRQVL